MSQQSDQERDGTGGKPPRGPKSRRLSRRLIKVGIGLGALCLLGGAFVGVAEHHTAQPSFCTSCHVMEPYYATWKADTHGGRLNVACVDCHYAPGERTTFAAKLRGLSQVASYFSGRYGKTRPRAHVAPESCMTAACHGDGKFMDKPLQVGTVSFLHSKHLKHTDQDDQTALTRLKMVKKELEQQLGADRFARLIEAAQQIGPADVRVDAMLRLCVEWSAEARAAGSAGVVSTGTPQCANCPAPFSPVRGLPCEQHANFRFETTELEARRTRRPASFPGTEVELLYLSFQ